MCHNIANGIKPGIIKTNTHAADCSKSSILGRKVIYVRCINCSYTNVAKGICLLEKKHFCLYWKNFMQVRAFERYIS